MTYDDGKKKSGKKININPLYIHILILVVAAGLLFLFFNEDFSFNEKKIGDNMIFVGNMENFEKEYSGNLQVYSADFTLETNNGEFKDSSKNFIIENFTGKIKLDNKSIVFSGNADEIIFGDNKFNLRKESFSLISKKKTTVDLFFENTQLNFETGRMRINDELNYQFENGTATISNYNSSMTYDGIFSFSGDADEVNLATDKISITYKSKNEE